ncbi:TetR/AcrR family transcriptional regulator [Lactobacillus sp. UCMA15818]|uniref:TetR/AcrR family transcriptional regulator n=1 Tax=Lactobacillaceae TaxID=33958 RepID=UPI0025B07F8C|nr:TetR/AcrR family transcriptional regulator [Lactobacillus sp. UCMA15818]MDN2453240.1 TetR/AcrR family transcriptional regulator [Lactobacillus sp. UCMA15818]
MYNSDKRIIKTERLIKSTFIDLLIQKDCSKITIKEICNKALISKSTFYAHYEDKYTLLQALIDEYAEQFELEVHKRLNLVSTKDDNALQILTHITQSVSAHNQQLSVLLKESKGDDCLESKLRNILINEASTYLAANHENKKFSNEFLAKIYTEITLASLSFILMNHDNLDLLEQQAHFIDVLQRTMLANV